MTSQAGAATEPAAPRPIGNSVLTVILGNLITPIAAVACSPLLAQALGVDGRGEMAAGTAPLLFATAAATFGVPDAVTYSIARRVGLPASVLKLGLLLIAATGILATIASVAGAHALSGGSRPIQQLIVIASIALTPTLMATVLRATAAGLHRWNLVAWEQVISAGTRVIALAVLAGVGHLTPVTATVVMAVTPIFGGLVYLPMLRTFDRIGSIDTGSDEALRMSFLLSFGMRIWIGSLSGILLARLDQLIMTPLAGAYQLGLYAVGVSISEVTLVVNNAVRDVTFSADAAGSSDQRLTTSARVSSFACLVGAVILGLSLPWWLPVVFGAEFRPAIAACDILIAAVVVGTPGSIAGAGLSARGSPGLRSTSLFLGAVINVVMLLVLLPHFGAVGAAWATFAGNFVAGNANIWFLWRRGGVSPLAFYGLRRHDAVEIVGYLSTLRAKLARAPIAAGETTPPPE